MYRHIIVPLDGSREAEAALPLATRLARCLDAGVVLLRAVGRPAGEEWHLAPALRRPSAHARAQATRNLRRVLAGSQLAGLRGELTVERDSPAEAILAAAQRYDAALVVMTSGGREARVRQMFGSVTTAVLLQADVPVLVVRVGGRSLPAASPYVALPRTPLRMLVPLDGTPLAEAALEPAWQLLEALASAGQGQLHLVWVVPAFAADAEQQAEVAERYLSAVAARLREAMAPDSGHTVAWSVRFETDVPLALTQLAEGVMPGDQPYDLIAMATYGRGGLVRRLLGGVTQQVLRTTRQPVLVVRPADPAVEGRLVAEDTRGAIDAGAGPSASDAATGPHDPIPAH